MNVFKSISASTSPCRTVSGMSSHYERLDVLQNNNF